MDVIGGQYLALMPISPKLFICSVSKGYLGYGGMTSFQMLLSPSNLPDINTTVRDCQLSLCGHARCLSLGVRLPARDILQVTVNVAGTVPSQKLKQKSFYSVIS